MVKIVEVLIDKCILCKKLHNITCGELSGQLIRKIMGGISRGIMKSIKTKLITFLGGLMGVVCIGLGVVSFINASNALKSNIGKTIPKIAEQTASSIHCTY